MCGLLDRGDVVQDDTRELGVDRLPELRVLDELTVGSCRHGEAGRHRDPGREQLAERGALAAERGAVSSAELGERDGLPHQSRMVTVPAEPSTRMR